MADEQPLLTFPTDYPIKVVGRRSAGVRERIDAIVLLHAPDLDHERTTERDSSNARFVSITYTVRATSREQIVALATALQASDDVVMLI
jgi:putative lipoic acid-binding regulatory protein